MGKIVYVKSCENCGEVFGTTTDSCLCDRCSKVGSSALFLMIGGFLMIFGYLLNIISC